MIEEQEFAESKKSDNAQPEPAENVNDVFMNIPEGIENDLPFK
jgi:hypothetical protein